jgi:hypothetical protein
VDASVPDGPLVLGIDETLERRRCTPEVTSSMLDTIRCSTIVKRAFQNLLCTLDISHIIRYPITSVIWITDLI